MAGRRSEVAWLVGVGRCARNWGLGIGDWSLAFGTPWRLYDADEDSSELILQQRHVGGVGDAVFV